MIGYCGYPDCRQRRELWDLIRMLIKSSLCMIEDYIDLLSTNDKLDSCDHPNHLIQDFRYVVHDASLIDII